MSTNKRPSVQHKQEALAQQQEVAQSLALVGAALREASKPPPRPTNDEDATTITSQRSWLSKMEKSAGDAESDEPVKPGISKMKMKLRAAVHAVKITNRQERRWADGTKRSSVVASVKTEAQHHHGPKGGLYFLSSRAQGFFESTFQGLGAWLVGHHHTAMALGLLVLLSGIPGTFFLGGAGSFLWFKVDTDLHAFALVSTTAYTQYEDIVHRHHGFFHPPRPSLIVLSPQSAADDAVLSHGFMRRALDILTDVYSLTVADSHGVQRGFADLCHLTGNAPDAHHGAAHSATANIAYCASRAADIFASAQIFDQATLLASAGPGAGSATGGSDYSLVLQGRDAATSAQMYGAFNASGVYQAGLRAVDASQSYTAWAPTTLQIPVLLAHTHDSTATALAKKWETALANYLTGSHVHSDAIRASVIVDSTFESAMQVSLDALTPWLFVVVFVMVLYSGTFLSTQTRTAQGEATQFSLVAQGSAVSGLAGFSAFGWIYYVGLESINVLCICAVFLVAAVGVDCTFIFISAMKAAGPEVKLADAVPMAMAEGASAITLTSLTSICAFFVSAAASGSQPAFLKFNVTMAIALTLNYIGFLLFFGGWQVHNEHRIMDGKMDLAPFLKRDTSKKLPEWVDVGNKLRLAINTRYAPLLPEKGGPCATACKLFGVLVLVGTVVVSFIFVGEIGVGMPDEYLVQDSSYLYDITRDFRVLTNSQRVTSISMHIEHLDMGSFDKLQGFVTSVLGPLRARDDVLTTSCLPALYYAYAAQTRAAGQQEQPWDAWLNSTAVARSLFGRSHHGTETGQFSGMPVPREVLCSVTGVVSTAADSKPRIAAMHWFTNFSASLNSQFADTCFPCDATRVTFFSTDWAMKTSFDAELEDLVWSTIGLALFVVGVVLLLALPVHRALVSVLNIFLVVFAMIGFMGYAGINYNLISYCTLTMAIGFCVDYTVEVMHFSVLGEATDSMGTKFGNAIKACGYDVLHGCATAIIGVFILGLSGAEYARLFSYMSLVMCAYGGAYALWCMPSSMIVTNMVTSGVGKAGAPAAGALSASQLVSTSSNPRTSSA